MKNFRKTAVLFIFFLVCGLPAAFAMTAAPMLSVIQREKEIQLFFLWDDNVDFTETAENGAYRLSFPVRIDKETASLEQIRTGLPVQWRKMGMERKNDSLDFWIRLPDKGRARAQKKGKSVIVSLTENDAVPAALPVSVRPPDKDKTKKTDKDVSSEKTDAIPPATKGPVISDDSENENKEQVSIDLSLIPYSHKETDVSLTLSDPESFKYDASGKKNTHTEDVSGYRTATLSFPWSRITGLAAFRRDGYLWLVFDRQGEFDFTLERDLYKDIIYEMVQIPHSHATIYRLITAKGYNPGLRQEGLLWIVDLMYQPIRPRQPLDLVLQRKTVFGPRIFIPLTESSQVLPMSDPEVGDMMYIIPIFDLGKGVAHARNFVDASFLPTAQGIVIVPNTEDLNVYSSTSGIEVRGPKGGMRFSSEDILSFLVQKKIDTDPMSQILDVPAWGGDAENYIRTLQKLQQNVRQADEKNKNVQRLILARYYFANGMYPECLSILRMLVSDSAEMAGLPGVVALRGAANFMMMRYDEAIGDLSSPLLKNDPDSEYWRAATLAASSRNPEEYLPSMKDNLVILQAYPQPIKTRLALAGLHAAVAGGDEFAIQNFMEVASNSGNSDAENDEIAFYHALWQESTGMYSMARDEMTRLAEGKDLYFRAMGGLEKIRMDARANAITSQERIEELERLSYAWRGGEFEYNLMIMLVAAYQEQKDFAQVLHILKDMKIRFGNTSESSKIQKMMEEIFQKLYLNDDGTLLSPVKAVALYNEFKELTPPDEKGAQLILRLADRLVSIDLLDSAASLLEEQLKQKVGVKEKGLLSTRLALIRLLNKEPENALKALKISEKDRFSEKLQKQRLHIKAKALADLKKTDEAAALLEDDSSEAGRMLKAEIYWQAQMWNEAADALKFLIKKPQAGEKLTDAEAQHVLNWAAALCLAGRTKVVMLLRENFMPYMKETRFAQAFDFITKMPQQGVMDFRQVAQEVEAAESFHSFAKEYGDMLKSQGLSETVH